MTLLRHTRLSAKDYQALAAKPKKREKPELVFHKTVAAFLARALPADAWWSTIGHGGGGKVRGAQLKTAGMKAGVPDVLIIHQGRALFIELKAMHGALSAEQIGCHSAIRSAGASVLTCKLLEQVEGALVAFGIPLKGTCVGRAA